MARRLVILTSLCLAALASGCLWGEPPPRGRPHGPSAPDDGSPLFPEKPTDVGAAIREHYTKFEYRIPMRDGVKLFTVAYVPKDTSRTYPILMERTPYSVGPYGIDNYRQWGFPTSYVREGFIFVMQDVRGQLMSEGTFVDVRPHAGPGGIDESTDAYDTVDFLVKNVPENNGRVGVSGISYPGFYAAQAAVNAHPAVKAVSPQAPVTEWFYGDDFHHNGAFFLAPAFGFYASFGKVRKKLTTKQEWGFDYGGADPYDFFLALGTVKNANPKYLENKIPFWNELLSHPNRDAWWKARDPRPYYVTKGPAVMTVGGFFDAQDCYGALETYRAFEKQSPGAQNALVMGPWRHGGWSHGPGDHHGDVTFGQATAQVYRDEIELPFFLQHLKGRGTGLGGFDAIIFETGTNVWQKYASWPPPGAKTASLRLQGKGLLGTGAGPGGDEGFDTYVSDPAHPVPYRAKTSADIDEDYMSEDQRFASRRTDVLTYASTPLGADVSLQGPLEATLFASTTGSDADFVVKLIDVYPESAGTEVLSGIGSNGGTQQLVRAEVMRARFRESFEHPVPFEPGRPAKVHFTLPDIAHTFRTGHRLMVQVQSSWFPLVDRNPQTFVPNIEEADEKDFRTATHRVYRTPEMPSTITVTLARGVLPP